MKDGKASFTAEIAAMYRAAESMRPQAERVCYDPFAIRFLPAAFQTVVKNRLLYKTVMWYQDNRKYPWSPRGEFVGRTRHIDDYLRARIADGIQQLVILGAGYDSRAYRFEDIKGRVKVFEVDHPSTQRIKRERIKQILGSLPDHVVYVPVDFETQKLELRLFECGYDSRLKTSFIWEGVTFYVSAEAVDETLAFVADNSGEGSSIIFNYVYKSVIDGKSRWPQAARVLKEMADLSEPWTFGIEEGGIEKFLSQRGFHNVVNADSDYCDRAYFRGRGRPCPFLATVSAVVKSTRVH